MKKIFFVLLSFLALNSFSQSSNFGLGLIIGEPTGLSAKYWTGESTAFDGSLAWSVNGRYDAIHLHADFLKHKFGLISVDKGQLPLYFGLGAKVVMANDPVIGIRIPLGISYIFDGTPLDAFFEIVPVLNLIPSTEFDVDGAIGLRYYF